MMMTINKIVFLIPLWFEAQQQQKNLNFFYSSSEKKETRHKSSSQKSENIVMRYTESNKFLLYFCTLVVLIWKRNMVLYSVT